MSFYSTQRLWAQEQQTVNVFNWEQILEKWNESLIMDPYVQVVIDNIKAASDPHSNYSYPLSHFLKYLNYEPKALTWFLYEVVSMRWMWGESRLDYVEELIKRPEIKLDEGFPVFPGSPLKYRSVRRFLKDSLSEDEQDFIDLDSHSAPSGPSGPSAPSGPSGPSTHIPSITIPSTPVHRSYAVEAPHAPRADRGKTYQDIVFHFQRPDKNGKGQPDDVIRIVKQSFATYSIKYEDGLANVTHKIREIGEKDVFNYLRNVINCNYFDNEPFQFIQMTLPGAPSVCFDGDMCAEARSLIYEAVQRTIDNWPEVA